MKKIEEHTAEIISLAKLNNTFPKVSNELIQRDAYIDNITKSFEEFDLLIIEGAEGIGKSSILIEFCQQNSLNSISYFVNPSDKYTHLPESLKHNLSQQIYYYSIGEISDEEFMIDDKFSSFQNKLRRKIIGSKIPLYFVFNGLSEMRKEDLFVFKNIIESLPWGQAKFLLSGDYDKLKVVIPDKVKYKTIEVMKFGILETRMFFKDITTNSFEIEELHKLSCKGIPSRLVHLKRLCHLKSVNDVIESDISENTDLFELDWKNVSDSKKQEKLLLILAFGENLYDIDKLSSISGIKKQEIFNELKKLDFIIVNEKEEVSFVSNLHRKFAKRKLKENEKEIYNMFIDYYMMNPSSEESVSRQQKVD